MSVLDELINTKNRHTLLIAAAGAGKTHTLIHYLEKLIQNGKIKPNSEQVIIFTFTKKAAEELSVRLAELLGSNNKMLNNMFIGTIHGWCNNFIQNQGSLSNTKILDELARTQLIQRIYGNLGINKVYEGRNIFVKIEKFERDIDLFYNENLSIDDKRIPIPIQTCLKKYFKFLESQRLMDFGYSIHKSISLLEKINDNKTNYHLFVDEYQDVNPSQVELLISILRLNSDSTLFAVGDPRQTIYQWRGSDINRILDFLNDFDDSEIFNIETNYRSRTGIVDFANIIARDMIFPENIKKKIKDMSPSKDREDSNISVINENSLDNHAEKIAQIIKYLHDVDGVKFSDMAVLMRSVVNKYGRHLMKTFNDQGIEYYSPNKNSGMDFIETFMISIINMIELISVEIVPRNRQEEKELIEKITLYLNQIKKYCKRTNNEQIHLALVEWYELLSKSSNKTKETKYEYYKNEAYNFRKQFFEFCKKIDFNIEPSNVEIQEGFSAITQIMRAIEEIYRRRFRDFGNIRDSPVKIFTNNLKWNLQNKLERWTEVGMDIDSGDRVAISTIHSAKGLQWPVVFVPFLWKGKLPLNNSKHETSFPESLSERYGTTIEDEKRVWYVAATRARDRLYYFSGPKEKHGISPFTYSAHINKDNKNIIQTKDAFKEGKLSIIKHYIRKKYFHLGVSNFLILLECPYHFYLRHVKGLEVPVGEEFGAGNVVHKVIERLLVNPEKTNFKEIIEEEVYLPLAENILEDKTKKSIDKKIERLVDSNILDEIQVGEYQFAIQIKNLIVTGIIDAIKETENELEIIDWKSSIHDRFKERYFNQIKVYTSALRSLGLFVKKGTLYDLSQEELSSANVDIDISNNSIKILMSKAEKHLDNLNNNNSICNSNRISCSACDVQEICPYVISS